MIGEEGCHASSGIDMVVKGQLYSRQPVDLVILLVVAVCANVFLNRLVSTL